MTRIAIAGGHGQIALHLTRLLAADGHEVRALIRNPDHRADVEDAGGSPHLIDLEDAGADELASALEGCDVLVFAAGAGPGSGAARQETVDYGAAVALRDACSAAGVRRYVMVSAMGTDDPPDGDDVFDVYLRAKSRADAALADSDLDWTIIRPGRLTDEPSTGRVALARHVDAGEIPRADVAAVLAAVIERPASAGLTLEVVSGDEDVADAVDRVARPSS